MEQPDHDLRPFQAAQATPRRFIAFGAAALLQIGIIWALATGLAQQIVEKLPQDIKTDIVKEKPPEQPKTPPPPPPDMVKPPPPFIPPPDIVVSAEPSPNTITQVTNQVAPPPKPAVTSPASIGRPHACGQRYYPALATRLGHEGTTVLGFTIGTDGSVRDVKVVQSSGFPELDDAAIPCAQGWQYKPAMQNGAPVEVPWQAKVTWKLNGG